MENLTKQIKELKEELNKLYAEQQIILKYLNISKLNEINTKIYKLRQDIKKLKRKQLEEQKEQDINNKIEQIITL